MNSRVEILAPAGSMESMMAAVNAGADAVYMGGSRFGARAYADNPEEDRFLEAIDYAHLHGCRLYMTVNTLVKESELGQLYDFLKPCYERGLDAVIVQDMGVFAFVREHFPDLHIHASTQMTVTGYRSAEILRELGATRVVTARELSLGEIAEIRDRVDIEIESFVHGALCYCYSGQCLLSSLIGGRSGNRGRCAQPCRLPYDGAGQGKDRQSRDGQGKDRQLKDRQSEDRYLLSLKDLCTLDILPDIIEAGVYSLKIEGRMKSPRYTAGVVSIYRKYVDRYLEHGRKGYRVDPEDKKLLLDLFDRGGFTEGYYRQHNGRDMVALKEKPAFREGNQPLFDRLDAEFVNRKKQEPICGHVTVCQGKPMGLALRTPGGEISLAVEGAVVQTAQNQPLSQEKLLKQVNKTGGTPFYFEDLTAELEGSCFVPVQALNELRREGMEKLQEAILRPYRRTAGMASAAPGKDSVLRDGVVSARSEAQRDDAMMAVSGRTKAPRIHVSLEDPACLAAAAAHPDVDEICLDAVGFGCETWADAAAQCHRAGKQCALLLPHIFRREAEQYFSEHTEELRRAGFDEIVLRSMEEVGFLKQAGLESIPWVFDAGLYVMNHLAAEQMQRLGVSRLTIPLELNSREIEELKAGSAANVPAAPVWELAAYGYLPAMVSAQCIVRTTKGCTHQPETIFLKDRTGKELPVKNHCRFCYNTVYNPSPLSLLGQERITKRLDPAVLRLSFTIESPQQMRAVLDSFGDHFRHGKDTPAPFKDFTRGHLKRGVE